MSRLPPTLPAPSSPATQTWSQNFSFDTFLIIAAFIVLVCAALAMAVQSDTWWQLRSGQYILETRQLPTTDPFSWTVRGGYWPNHEWLAEVFFYLAYQLGGMRLLAAVCATVVLLTWTLIHKLTVGSGKVRAYCLLAGVGAQAMVWSIRPALFSLFFAAAAIALLPHRKRHWLYPLLFLLWANAHGGVAFGGAILGAATVASLWTDRRAFWHWALITALSAAATLMTPLGLGLWRLVLHSVTDPVSVVIEEWMPPSLSWPLSHPFLGLLVATAGVLWLQRRSWRSHMDWTLILCALTFAALGLKSIRHTGTFALIAPILISRHFAHVGPMPAFPSTKRLVHVAALTILALAGALFVRERWRVQTDRPALEPNIVLGLRQCPGRLFNTYELGGNIIWAVPDRPVFVDNRWEPYRPDVILRTKYLEATGDYRAFFGEYEIQCAIVPAVGPLPSALARDAWVVAAEDRDYVVMARP